MLHLMRIRLVLASIVSGPILAAAVTGLGLIVAPAKAYPSGHMQVAALRRD
jgi:hypothetical protein